MGSSHFQALLFSNDEDDTGLGDGGDGWWTMLMVWYKVSCVNERLIARKNEIHWHPCIHIDIHIQPFYFTFPCTMYKKRKKIYGYK